MKAVAAIGLFGLVMSLNAQVKATPELDEAFSRLYSFDFTGAHAALDRHIAASPNDPVGYSTRASAHLFFELDRLGVLESEFFSNDERIADKKKLKPDPGVRAKLQRAVEEARKRATADLSKDANDTNALFSMCIADGVMTDYTALVERRQIASLSLVRSAAAYAARLLKADPHYYDAYLSTGITEYLIGSMPFFVRWFVRIDNIKPDKSAGMDKLSLTARHGRYLKPFAKILLAIAYLREKKPTRSKELLADLSREFPENPLFRRELEKVSHKLSNGELKDGSD
ncbi:MAG: hypothetical protein ACKV22_02195 [Bryobacteraceae bacterium]